MKYLTSQHIKAFLRLYSTTCELTKQNPYLYPNTETPNVFSQRSDVCCSAILCASSIQDKVQAGHACACFACITQLLFKKGAIRKGSIVDTGQCPQDIDFDFMLRLAHNPALRRTTHGIFRAGVQLYMRASGHARVPGYLVPTAEIE
jgi:hypothetical protein